MKEISPSQRVAHSEDKLGRDHLRNFSFLFNMDVNLSSYSAVLGLFDEPSLFDWVWMGGEHTRTLFDLRR